MRTLDGAGDELREEGQECREEREIRDRLGLAAIHVDRVAHRLERVERNAHGQEDVRERPARVPAERRERVDERVGEEIEVFEKAEDDEIRAEAQQQEGAALFGFREPPEHRIQRGEKQRQRDHRGEMLP